ncbi:fungal-specific transcription factor domain-containing protein [Amylocarpus encephaloides]|uniref:Fungal-specific transcription factor domain-containing protein n=1 Tax=Amylocarpus encephaloides TaxID=45428 RepID=A0A9P8C3X0_9HELO|nr:fungal-specific transcription factor domain-containing protein [Amylocarpus encephaloides]
MSAEPAETNPEKASTPIEASAVRQCSKSSSSAFPSTPTSADTNAGADGKPLDKTISCVSCRKRKLKCDRVKPRCGTCTRLRHECEFPERRRNIGSKRRNMKELEARLAQVETQLVSETMAQKNIPATSNPNPDQAWSMPHEDVDTNIDDSILDSCFENEQFDFGFLSDPLSIPIITPPPLSQEVISLGLDEPLPPQDMIDSLHETYFDKFHPTLPIMHKFRYFAALDRAPHMRPPICLRYAIWTMAASLSDDYLSYEEIFYRRARKYLDAAEMKGFGETFVSIYHAQTWSLIAHYEAKKTYFSRSWMSVGRMVRLVHMLGLHRIDSGSADIKQIILPPRDWIETEERRRAFWAAFYGDRWASSGTGWPMLINEKEIMTNLPASEPSFESGMEEKTITLAEALTPAGAPFVSTFGGVILSSALFGHNFQHLHWGGSDDRPEDYANGEFWKRHRRMDNVLSNTFMFLPDHLRIPGGQHNMSVIFLHMNIHASTICLHQAGILTAEKYKIDEAVIKQSQARSLMSAQEIANIMRTCSHIDASRINSWMGFCLYVAGGVTLHDVMNKDPSPQSLGNLEFILAALNALGHRHAITKHFTAQLELDIEASGLDKGRRPSCPSPIWTTDPNVLNPPINNMLETVGDKEDLVKATWPNDRVPSVPTIGLLAERSGRPMTLGEVHSFANAARDRQPPSGKRVKASVVSGADSTTPPEGTNNAPIQLGGDGDSTAAETFKFWKVQPESGLNNLVWRHRLPSFTPIQSPNDDPQTSESSTAYPNTKLRFDSLPSFTPPTQFPFRRQAQDRENLLAQRSAPVTLPMTTGPMWPDPGPPQQNSEAEPPGFYMPNPTFFDGSTLRVPVTQDTGFQSSADYDILLNDMNWDSQPNQGHNQQN